MTISSTTVPPVDKLIVFLRERANQPQNEVKTSHSTPAFERKSSSKQRNPGHKGVTTSQSQQAEHQGLLHLGRVTITNLNPFLMFHVGTPAQSAVRHILRPLQGENYLTKEGVCPGPLSLLQGTACRNAHL